MPLLTEKPPKGFEKVLDASVADCRPWRRIAGARARRRSRLLFRVLHLGADAVAAGKGLAAAQPTGWLTTLATDGEVRGTVELVPPKSARKGAAPPAGVSSAVSRPDRCTGDWPRRSRSYQSRGTE